VVLLLAGLLFQHMRKLWNEDVAKDDDKRSKSTASATAAAELVFAAMGSWL